MNGFIELNKRTTPGRRPALLCLAAAALLALVGCCTFTQHYKHSGKRLGWQGASRSEPLTLRLYQPTNTRSNALLPVVFYLYNLASSRAGWESDAHIVRSLQAEGYLVVTVDFAKHTNARVPFINRDLGKLRDDVRAKKLLGEFKVDMAHVFILPESYRLKRDVVYYSDTNRVLAMDIIYPSKPKRPVGTVLEFSCDNKDRFGNFSLSVCSDTLLDAFATEGYAVAMADHPVAPPYKGLDAMPDSAWKIKAAVRTLRAEGKKLGLSPRIVPVGFSRGSGMALMLVTTAGMAEFEGRGESPGVSSEVQGGVIMSGRFTYLDLLPGDEMLPRYAEAWGERDESLDVWRAHGALDYLKRPVRFPLFLTINGSESPDALHQMDVLRNRLDELGSPYSFHLDQEPRGHKVVLDAEILEAMRRYMRQRLGPSSARAPSVNKPLRVVLIGDSTVADYAASKPARGWGMYVQERFDSRVTVTNLAANGRSTKTFIQEGRWAGALALRPDYVLIQFGHNDSHAKGRPESTDAAGDYQDYLRQYIREARAIGAVPILVTPMLRRNYTADGKLDDALQPYADAMKSVAAGEHAALIDLHSLSRGCYETLGAVDIQSLASEPNDRTHFNERGARGMAGLVVAELAKVAPELATHLTALK